MKLEGVWILSMLMLAVAPTFAATMSGTVRDEHGQPVVNVDLDFVLVATGNDTNPSDSDATDINGAYSSMLPPGIYDVFFTPIPGSSLAGHAVESVNLNLNQTLDVVLRDAWFVSGDVRRSDTGLAAIGVDLDFRDLSTGQKIFTPRDNADLSGKYNVAVPSGIYEVTFQGPEPDLPSDPPQLAHGVIEEVSVDGNGNVSLPEITLPLGYVVEGEVFDFIGIPVAGADLDAFIAGTSQQIFTKNDNTDASGAYQTILPAGTYDIEISAPDGLALASMQRTSVVVVSDTFVATELLSMAHAVSGVVTDPDGRPLPRVDLDLSTTSTGVRVPTAHDDSDSVGQYLVYVSSGTFDVAYDPQANRAVEEQTSFGVGVFSDMALPLMVLPYHDADGDGVVDVIDGCPFRADGPQLDLDADGVGDTCDNCPSTANPRQEDNDRDRVGNACDDDDDNDGTPDTSDTDLDGDAVANLADNCPEERNRLQLDSDGDGAGDACDSDDGEVEYLEARTADGFVWRPETGALGYQVYRQKLGWISAINFGRCLHDASEGTALFDADRPLPGEGFSYLATATTSLGEGKLGHSSSGETRPNLRACP